ncbi:MAG: PAS domain S-box protein, partial [Anaerolineae bacterium]|nr:PAS domain S-box protein [Anaerolineae bacterium]
LVIIDVNQAACQMLGYSRDELIGMSITGIDPVKTKEEIENLWWQTREVGSLTFETFHQAKSGRIFPVEIMVSHISHEGKELNCAFARDITQRKQAEEELKDSQALLNESQQFARMGSWSFNSRNNKLIWSDSTFRLFGFAPQAFQPSFEFLLTRIHPDDTPTVSEHFEATRQHKVFHPLTYRVILPDGTVRWILNTGTVEANEAGEMTRFFGMVQDITERKQAEEALQQSEERLRQAVRAGNIGIFDYDHVTNYLYVSPELRSIYGWDDDESAIEENFFRQIHPEDHERIRHNTQRVDDPTGDGSFDVEHRIVTRQGLTCWLNTRSHTFFEGEGDARHPVRTIGAVANITERKNAETAIRQINEELEQRVQERTRALEEANEEIKYFAYIVSHDLRAPLVNLKGFASELRSGLKIVEEGCNSVLPLLDPTQRDKMLYALKEDIPEALRFIESSVSSMDVFTKAILKLSRLGRLQLELVQVDTRSMVEKILESLTYQINQLGVKVRLGDLPHITADVVSLEQIFGNILTNAVAYLDPNRQGEIEIQAESKTGETVFYIRDNGR